MKLKCPDCFKLLKDKYGNGLIYECKPCNLYFTHDCLVGYWLGYKRGKQAGKK